VVSGSPLNSFCCSSVKLTLHKGGFIAIADLLWNSLSPRYESTFPA
jgi:hypothetical protein